MTNRPFPLLYYVCAVLLELPCAVGDVYIVDLRSMAELNGELGLCSGDERKIELILHEVDRAAAETAAHYTAAGDSDTAGELGEEVELVAAHLIKLAHAEMGLVHHLAYDLLVTSLKGVADVEDSLHLADDILCAEEVLA